MKMNKLTTKILQTIRKNERGYIYELENGDFLYSNGYYIVKIKCEDMEVNPKRLFKKPEVNRVFEDCKSSKNYKEAKLKYYIKDSYMMAVFESENGKTYVKKEYLDLFNINEEFDFKISDNLIEPLQVIEGGEVKLIIMSIRYCGGK